MHSHLSIEDVDHAMTTNQYEFVVELCDEILESHHFDDLSNQALHRRAVALRLLKRYIESAEAFEMAMSYGLDDHFLGRVMRDYGALRLDTKHYKSAAEFTLESIQLLEGDMIEQAVSYGFLGRIQLSDPGTWWQACLRLMMADRVLHGCGNKDYELNNLIWFMKVLSLSGRLEHLSRALRLSWQLRTRQRAIEAYLITISPRLYESIKRRRG